SVPWGFCCRNRRISRAFYIAALWPSHRRSLGPPGRVCCAAATSAGDGPGRWGGGPSAAAPAMVRGGGVGGRRPGFGDTDVAEKPPWTGSRRPGRGPPTPPPPRQPPATAEGPARHLRRDTHPQRRHNTATPQTPANAHESQRRL